LYLRIKYFEHIKQQQDVL